MLVKDNKYIPTEDKDFFILLRIGLWQRVEEPLSDSPNWAYIYQLACEQTVQGIVADGIGIYQKQHPDLNITQDENDKFLSASAQIVRRNYSINQLQAKICKLFEEHNITYVVLKGQGVAQAYPKPMLRCSGDIDFLVYSEDYENYKKATKLLYEISDSHGECNKKELHQGFKIDDIEVEIHGKTVINMFPRVSKVLEEERILMFRKGNFHIEYLASQEANLPNLEYHTFFLFCHILKHMVGSGIGLRQYCDLAMFMSTNIGMIDTNQLHHLISKSNSQRIWYILMSFISLYFKPDFNKILKTSSSTSNNKICKHLWNECKIDGNFGHNKSVKIGDNVIIRHYKEWRNASCKISSNWMLSPEVAIRRLREFAKNYFVLIKRLIIR